MSEETEMEKYPFIAEPFKDPFKDPFRMANAILFAGIQVYCPIEHNLVGVAHWRSFGII